MEHRTYSSRGFPRAVVPRMDSGGCRQKHKTSIVVSSRSTSVHRVPNGVVVIFYLRDLSKITRRVTEQR